MAGGVPSWFAHSEAEKCDAYSAGVVDERISTLWSTMAKSVILSRSLVESIYISVVPYPELTTKEY